jgi:hypothetical protein
VCGNFDGVSPIEFHRRIAGKYEKNRVCAGLLLKKPARSKRVNASVMGFGKAMPGPLNIHLLVGCFAVAIFRSEGFLCTFVGVVLSFPVRWYAIRSR